MEGDRGGLVVYGGTFDPPHVGHLILACDVVEMLDPDRFLIVPAGDPPHREGEPISPAGLRLEMARAAFAPCDRLEVSDLEVVRPGPSYAVDTLRVLSEQGAAPLTLLIGEDQYRVFDEWHRPEEIFRLAEVAVMERDDSDTPPRTWRGEDGFRRIATRRIDVSSTEIRERVRDGRPVSSLLPPGVGEIIHREGLYLEPAGIRPGSRG